MAGFNISALRPAKSVVETSNGYSCFTADQKVLTKRGLVPIANVIPQEDVAITSYGSYTITELHRNGVKPVVEIEFEDGRRIKTTMEHRFIVIDKTGNLSKKSIKEIINSNNEFVPVFISPIPELEERLANFGHQRTFLSSMISKELRNEFKIKNQSLRIDLDEDFAWILGQIVGDGYIYRNRRHSKIVITANYSERRIVNKIATILGNKGIKYTIYDEENFGRTSISIFNSELVRFLDCFELLKEHSINASVPKWIWTSTPEIIAAFLSGYFDADGSCSGDHWRIKTISGQLAYEVQELFSCLGIKASVSCYESSQENCQPTYVIEIPSARWKLLARNLMNQSIKISSANDDFVSNNDDFVSNKIGVWPFNALKIFVSSPELRNELSKTIMPYNSETTGFTSMMRIYKKLLEQNEYVQANKLANIIRHVPCTIKSIRPIGEQEVFDITVDQAHVYLVNGVEVSNSGPVGFAKKFDFTADQMTENNSRKGAIKLDLNDWHPNIFEFIHSKDDTSVLKRMNISVSLSDKFMNAVLNNQLWDLKFPDYSWNKEVYDNEWNGIIEDWEAKGYPAVVYKTIEARKLYREIMECAWKTGEPGVSFRDTMDRYNPNPHIGRVIGSNPCAEFVSVSYNSCNLGSINLALLISGEEIKDNPDYKKLIIKKLKEVVPVAFRFLDNMITVNKLPLQKIEAVTKAVRSVGLGVMGLSDLLYQLGIKYNSEEGYKLTKTIFETIYDLCLQTSCKLAEEKGVYEAWEGSTWSQKGIKVRNSNFLSIAPTGSISFIANASSGIEPVYALVMTRLTNEGYKYYIVNPFFEKELRKRGLYSDEILEKVSFNNGSCQGIKEIPKDMQEVFVTTYDMSPAEHVKMLAVIQSVVDLSVSKTVNLPNQATVDDIMDVYIDAWQQGIKGITIYRDGCRDNQVLTTGKKEDKPVTIINEDGYVDVNPAMEVAFGKRIKVKTGCGHLWLFFFVDNEHCLAEIWTQVSGGGCKANIESMSRLASLCFRSKVDPKHILDQLSSAFCKTSIDNVGSKSCGHVIAKEIKKFLDSNKTIIEVNKDRVEDIENLLKNTPVPNEPKEKSNSLTLESDTGCSSCPNPCSNSKDKKAVLDESFYCPDGTPHKFNGEGCQTCVKCNFSKCN